MHPSDFRHTLHLRVGLSEGGCCRPGRLLLSGSNASSVVAVAGEDLAGARYRARARVSELARGVRVRRQPVGAFEGETDILPDPPPQAPGGSVSYSFYSSMWLWRRSCELLWLRRNQHFFLPESR